MKLIVLILILTICSCKREKTIQPGTKLDLSGQNLRSIPDSIFGKTDLVYLDLGSSDITFYPPLSALVDSNTNDITELPNKIDKLINLKVLILNSNRLSKLPDCIIKLTKLEVLDLSKNKDLDIVHEIDKITQLPNLKELRIVDVKLSSGKIEIIKKALHPDTKIILTATEYVL